MNDAVAGLDVGHDDGGVVDHDVAVDDGDVDLLALDRGGGLAVEGDGGLVRIVPLQEGGEHVQGLLY